MKTKASFSSGRRHAMAAAAASAAATLLPRTASAAGGTGHETPDSMVAALHTAFGEHHARAVHAKGTVLLGRFVASPGGQALSSATVL
ncbi:MAG: catalase, partial [Alcaligenaceae bacterium]